MDEHLLRFNKTAKITYIDVETQNLLLNEFHNLPWQVGMIQTVGGQITARHNIHVKWPEWFVVGVEAARITRYNKDYVQSVGRDPKEVAELTRKLLVECDYVVGQNIIGFDYYVINSFFRKVGIPEYNFIDKLIDTKCIAKGLKMGLPYRQGQNLIEYQYKVNHTKAKGVKCSQNQLCKDYQIVADESKLHDALYDLEINHQIFEKLKWAVEI